jgi:hypothetical protein
VQDLVDTGQRAEGEGGKQAADLVGRQRGQPAEAGSRSPF